MEKELEKIMRILEGSEKAGEVRVILNEISNKLASEGTEVNANADTQSDKVYLYAHKKVVAETGKYHFDPMTDIDVDFDNHEAKMFMYANTNLTEVQEQYSQPAMSAILCGYDIILIELDKNLFKELEERLKDVQNIVFTAAKKMTEEFNDVRTQLNYEVSVEEGFSIFLRNVHTLMLGIETLGQGVSEEDGKHEIINIREYAYEDSFDDEEEFDEEDDIIDYDIDTDDVNF